MHRWWLCPQGGFNCSEPNLYWRADFTCGCAYSEGRYDAQTVLNSCGPGAQGLFSERETEVTNYDISHYLLKSPKAYMVSQLLQ
jgi:hypothetical protein